MDLFVQKKKECIVKLWCQSLLVFGKPKSNVTTEGKVSEIICNKSLLQRYRLILMMVGGGLVGGVVW